MFPLSVKAAAITSSIATAIAVGLMAFGLHSCAMGNAAAAAKATCTAEKTAITKDCQNDKKLTNNADATIQGNHSRNDAAFDDRMRDTNAPACVPVAVNPGGPAQKTAAHTDVHAAVGSVIGISRAELYKITRDADNDADDLAACETFLRDTWAAKGQDTFPADVGN